MWRLLIQPHRSTVLHETGVYKDAENKIVWDSAGGMTRSFVSDSKDQGRKEKRFVLMTMAMRDLKESAHEVSATSFFHRGITSLPPRPVPVYLFHEKGL